MCKVIGILSLKGGVGKTSAVVSLGAAIAGFGKRTLLIDGNFSAPNLGIHFNVINPTATLNNVLRGDVNITNSIQKIGDLDIIPASVFDDTEVNPFKLKTKIKGVKNRYDFVLLDSPPALNEETLAIMLASDEIFIVTTPDYPTLSATLKSIRSAQERGAVIDGLILNKVHNKDFELSFNEIEKNLEVPILARVPYDIDFLRSLYNFTPVLALNPRSRASQEYKKLAATLIGEKFRPFGFRRIFGIAPKREDINRDIFYERVFG